MITIPEIPNRNAYINILNYCTGEWSSPVRIKTLTELKDKNIKNIWDLGANMGIFGDVCLQYFPNVLIDEIEPDAINFNILKYNFINNSNIRLHNFGIYYGATQGQSMNVIGDPSPGGYMFELLDKEHLGIYNNNVVLNNSIFYMKTLEDVFTTSPDLIKIDVEGSEYNIIEHSTLLKNARFLILEFHNHNKSYIEKFISTHLPMFILKELTNEHYGGEYHWFTFLIKNDD
jgi:FkbM family methyltransferase